MQQKTLKDFIKDYQKQGKTGIDEIKEAVQFLRSTLQEESKDKDFDLIPSLNSNYSQDTRYKLLRNLGEGGMGVVQLVEDSLLGREVALKTVKTDDTLFLKQRQKMLIWRLRREAAITATLEHPNIVPIYDLQELSKQDFKFTMRKVEGKTFRELLSDEKEEPSESSKEHFLSIFLKVCDAVAYAHSKGVVHRDLKPDNIMVGQFGEVYVMDWGIAKKIDLEKEVFSEKNSDITITENSDKKTFEIEEATTAELEEEPLTATSGSTATEESDFKTIGGLGTSGYMSPEQSEKASLVTAQSDIYALGQILRECYTRLSPYEEIKLKLDQNLPLGSSFKFDFEKELPTDVEAIIKKAQAEQPKNRYPTVSEMVRDIKRFQRHEWVSAREKKDIKAKIAFFQKWFKRNKLQVGFFATLFVGFLGFFIYNKFQVDKKYYHQFSQAIEKQKEIQKITGIDKPSLTQKVSVLLNSFSWLNGALLLKPNNSTVQEKKIEVGKTILKLCYRLEDFSLASYIANELQLLQKEENSRDFISEVKLQQFHKTNYETTRLLYWREQFIEEDSKDKELEGLREDLVYEISQFTEEITFRELLKIIQEAQEYYRNLDKFKSPQKESFYNSIIEALGRLGNQKAVYPLFAALEEVAGNYNPKNRNNNKENWMASLTNALGHLKAHKISSEIAVFINDLRFRFGQYHFYSNKTTVSFRKLSSGVSQYYQGHLKKLEELKKNSTTIKEKEKILKKIAKFYIYRANLKKEQKNLKGAIEDYNHSIETDSTIARAYNERGVLRFHLNNLEDALKDLNKCLQLKPTMESAYIHRGIIYQKLKDYNMAIRDFDKAIELDPENHSTYIHRGELKKSQQDYQGALFELNKAIHFYKDSLPALLARAIVKRELKDYQGALLDFDQILHLDPKLALAYKGRGEIFDLLKEYQKAFEDFDRALRINPNLASVYCSRGHLNKNLNKHKAALFDFNQAIQLKPKEAYYYRSRATLRQKLKQYKEALADLKQSIQLAPKNSGYHYSCGVLYTDLKQFKESIKSFDKAIQLDSKNVLAYRRRGLLYKRLKQDQKALIDLEKATQLDIQLPIVYLAKAEIKRNLGRYQDALQEYNFALTVVPKEKNSDKALVYTGRGTLKLMKLKDYKGALKDFTQGLQVDSQNEDLYHRRGLTKEKLQDYKGALQDFEQALLLNPKHIETYQSRGKLFLRLKQYEASLQDLLFVYKFLPNDFITLYQLAVLYELIKQFDSAIQFYLKAWKQQKNPKLLKRLKNLLLKQIQAYKDSNPSKSLAYLLEYKKLLSKEDPRLKQIETFAQQLKKQIQTEIEKKKD